MAQKLTLDQILQLMGDTFDSLVAPFKVYRNNNNKIWLIFQGIAAGVQLINDIVVSLSNKFDPANCSDEDLASTASLVGTVFLAGKSSQLTVTVHNSDSVSHTLAAGLYKYTSVSGEAFLYTMAVGTAVPSGNSMTMAMLSADIGAYPVSAQTSITVVRDDSASIDPNFAFSCADNALLLGYLPESNVAFRQRILSDTNRQDAISELEIAVRNIVNVLECNLLFNPTGGSITYDGIVVPPFFLLIAITGSPDSSVGAMVAKYVPYLTVMTDANKKFLVVDSHLLGGSFPVYYMNHARKDFSLIVTYRFNGLSITQANAESFMGQALSFAYGNMSRHIDTLTVADVSVLLTNMHLTSVSVIAVDMLVDDISMGYIDVPKTRLLNLSHVQFTGYDTNA